MRKILLIAAFALFGSATFATTQKTLPLAKKHAAKKKMQSNLQDECGYGFWCGVTVTGPCGMDYATLLWVQEIVCGGDGDCTC